MRRHTRRYVKTGKYKKEHFWNKDRKTWFEIMCLAVVAIWGVVAADLHPVAEAFYSIPEKYEIYNLKSDFTKFREPLKVSQDTDDAEGDTGETAVSNDTPEVEAVSDSEPRESEDGSTPVMEYSPSSVEAKILKAWEGTGNGKIAVAVAKAESGKNLKTDAIGWNCHYYNAQGKRYSKACNPEDRPKAWSVDCGVMQINHIGKTCPAHLFNPDENIKIGKAKYDNSEKRIGIGFYPWMAFRNNLHLKYL